MKFWISRIGYRCFLPLCLSVLFVCTGRAQSAENTRVDVFMGAELHYRDIFHNKIYEVLVNLTPGVKWYMGNRPSPGNRSHRGSAGSWRDRSLYLFIMIMVIVIRKSV